MQNLEWIHELRHLSDSLWTACSEYGIAEELLLLIQRDAEDLLEQGLEGADTAAGREVLASWHNLNALAAEYITSSERIDECLWTPAGGAPDRRGLPLELVQAFARHCCAIAAVIE